MKERIISSLGQFIANHYKLPRYGKISNFKIDKSAHKILFNLNLKGETDPIEFEGTYRVIDNGRSATLVFDSIRISREWIDCLAQDFLPKRIDLNNIGRAILKILL